VRARNNLACPTTYIVTAFIAGAAKVDTEPSGNGGYCSPQPRFPDLTAHYRSQPRTRPPPTKGEEPASLGLLVSLVALGVAAARRAGRTY
jgi:hypothetical protein